MSAPTDTAAAPDKVAVLAHYRREAAQLAAPDRSEPTFATADHVAQLTWCRQSIDPATFSQAQVHHIVDVLQRVEGALKDLTAVEASELLELELPALGAASPVVAERSTTAVVHHPTRSTGAVWLRRLAPVAIAVVAALLLHRSRRAR